jgi:hypothetical protein
VGKNLNDALVLAKKSNPSAQDITNANASLAKALKTANEAGTYIKSTILV